MEKLCESKYQYGEHIQLLMIKRATQLNLKCF